MNEINILNIKLFGNLFEDRFKKINLTLYISRPVLIIINFYFPLSLLLIELFWTPKCKHAVFQLLSIEDTY